MSDQLQQIYAHFAAADEPRLPERFQSYVLDKNKIGEGPTSFCYRARHTDGGAVRLKVFRRRLCEQPDFAELFRKVARLASEYRGQNLLPFRAAGSHSSALFFEYEHREAVNLRELICNYAPLHPDLAALVAQGIIAGLNQIHGLRPSPGMGNLIPLHRDLKPENVLVAVDGKVLLTDIDAQQFFCFADRVRVELPYSTAVYESPEQLLKGGYADRRSDIYALGLILLEMLTGKRLFAGTNVHSVRQNVREQRRASLSSITPKYRDGQTMSLLKSLLRLADNLIKHDPDRRPSSLLDIEGQLQKYFQGSSYDDPEPVLSEFLRCGAFECRRRQKKGIFSRLLGD